MTGGALVLLQNWAANVNNVDCIDTNTNTNKFFREQSPHVKQVVNMNIHLKQPA